MQSATHPAQRLADGLDRVSGITGKAISWLTLAMVLVSCTVVLMRYLFDTGWIWLQESVTWMHAMVFFIGAAYTLEREEHVRVDILYQRMDPRGQAWVNVLGVLLLLLPTCGLMLWSSADYVAASWRVREVSQEAGGLPALYVLKAVIPVSAVLLSLQGLALLLRNLLVLTGKVSRPAAGQGGA